MPGLLDPTFGLTPFDPDRHSPQDVGLGGPSTEYIATEFAPDGTVMNFPQIWFDQSGKAQLLPFESAMRLALEYEGATGNKFPRFNSIGAASEAAMHRSALGGGMRGLLVDQ